MSFRFAAAIVFVGSFCLMVIEIVAGRMIAPYLGSSLYSWTSVIGVILTGITLGNAFGGITADRFASRQLLGNTFFISGIFAAFIPLLGPYFGRFFSGGGFPLPIATLLFSVATFFPVSFFLSFISPITIKLVLHNLAETGTIVGRIYAVSAFGSILGTFAAGFFFIAYIGTLRIVWIIAIFLFLFGVTLWGGALWRKKRNVFFLLMLLTTTFFIKAKCTEETQYYCIRITTATNEGKVGFTVLLDHLVHSFVFPDDPAYLRYDYEKVSSWLIANASARASRPLRILFLGGGGYTLPRYVSSFYSEHAVTVVEIDPRVTEANYQHLGLSRTTSIVTVNEDARRYLERTNDRYDIIFGDAFNDFAVPFHLTTQEFHTIVNDHLAPGGLYAANVIDDTRGGRFLASMLATFRVAFPFTYLAPLSETWEKRSRNTLLVVGSRAPIDAALLSTHVPRGRETETEKERHLLALLSDPEYGDFIVRRRGIILTDDYAPVDNFLASVFRAAQ